MNFDLVGLIQLIALAALPVTFAITLHEAAHGYAARHFGDYTAANAGRITLNPLRHIDPVGTVAVPLLILLTSKLLGGGGILFGWAKPVPVNFGQLRSPKRDMLWVAAAGPAATLAMAIFWILVYKLADLISVPFFSEPMKLMAIGTKHFPGGIGINVLLMVLNLLPLPPLDGGRIAVSLLPGRLAWRFAMLEPYGFIILLVLLFSGVLNAVLWPFIGLVVGALVTLFNIR
ncbi:MAG TPA: site-2 protease family protein [Burkholderiales bacterium]|nr:site-2 protease family protein [Burkholderiales bacterium]